MNAKPLRVAIMIGSMEAGGAEGQAVELLRGLRARGHIVRLYVLHSRGPHLQTLKRDGIAVMPIALPKLRPWFEPAGKFGAIRSMQRTVSDLRRFRPDVLHAMLFEAETWATMAKLLGAPGKLITSRLNLGHYKDTAPWKQTVQNQYNRLTSLVIANSRVVARDAARREKNLKRSQIRVIYNGVDLRPFDTATPVDWAHEFSVPTIEGPVAICVANLFAYKGHRDLIEAWRTVHVRFPNARLFCVGRDAGMGTELNAMVAKYKLQNVVHFIGARDDVPRLMKSADLLVHPSHEEGFPNVILEAMSAILPIVSTNVGGIPEAIAEGRSGLLVPPKQPNTLAEAAMVLLGDEEKRTAFGQRGRKIVEKRFSIEQLIARHEKIYRSTFHDPS